MFNKRVPMRLLISTTGITASAFLLVTACGTENYIIMIPKISELKVTQIREEVKTETLTEWLKIRQAWGIKQWLEPLGYIGGGNVKEENISSIKVEGTPTEIKITIRLDSAKKIRFLKNKLELVIQVPLI